MTTANSAPHASSRWEFSVVSILFGAILIVLGVLAFAMPVISTIATTVAIGACLAVGGIAGLIAVFRERGRSGWIWGLLWAISAVALGALLVVWPVSGALSLTLFLAAAFIVRGVFAIGLAISRRRALRSWGWVALGGAVTLILGLMVLFSWPASGVLTLGILVGVDFIFYGAALLVAAVTAPRLVV